jgi:FAD/FMN-containing dehydrogenase
VLLVELDGQPESVAAEHAVVEPLLRAHHARSVLAAETAVDRARLWQGRKKAFGAMGRIAPDLVVQDAWCRDRTPDPRPTATPCRYGCTSQCLSRRDGNLRI